MRGAAGDHTVTPPPATLPPPVVVATTAPLRSTTVRERVNACVLLALFHTSTEGVREAAPVGEPSAASAMLPVTLEGAYTPHGAMYGPGVVTAVSHTERYRPPPSYLRREGGRRGKQ